jgi:Mor family transcriptional regulator
MLDRSFFSTQRERGRGNRKLDVDRVREIKRRLEQGERVVELAQKFRVHQNTVYEIRSGKRWGSV